MKTKEEGMMEKEDIIYEIGMRNHMIYDLSEWTQRSDHKIYAQFFLESYRAYCKYNLYDSNLIFEYVDKNIKTIGGQSFFTKKVDFITINFNTLPIIKSYFYSFEEIISTYPQFETYVLTGKENFKGVDYIIDNDSNRVIYINIACEINDTNKKYLEELICIANLFIFAHEQGHVLNGHTRFISENKVNKIERKTLEMDADAYAAIWVINHMRRNISFIHPIEELFGNVLFAIMTVFFLCDDGKESDIYFSPFMRVILIMDVLRDEYKLLTNEDLRVEFIMRWIEYARKVYAIICKKNYILEKRIEDCIYEEKEYSNSILKQWKELREKLQKYSFEKLAE